VGARTTDRVPPPAGDGIFYFRFLMMALDNSADMGIVIDCNRERCDPVP